jgi:hypothetical protein
MKILIVGGLGHGKYYGHDGGRYPRSIRIRRSPSTSYQGWTEALGVNIYALEEEDIYTLVYDQNREGELHPVYLWNQVRVNDWSTFEEAKRLADEAEAAAR